MLLSATIHNFRYNVDGSDSPFILSDNVRSKNPAPALLVKFMSNAPPEQPLFDYNRLNTGDEAESTEPSDQKSKPGVEVVNHHGKFEVTGTTEQRHNASDKTIYSINSKRRRVDDFSESNVDEEG